jgi:hypothetical protein
MNIIKLNEPLQSGNEHPLPHRKLERVKTMQKLLTDSSNSFLFTHHKAHLNKDKIFIKKILNGVKTRRPSGVSKVFF